MPRRRKKGRNERGKKIRTAWRLGRRRVRKNGSKEREFEEYERKKNERREGKGEIGLEEKGTKRRRK